MMSRRPILALLALAPLVAGCAAPEQTTEAPVEEGVDEPPLLLDECPRAFVTMTFSGNFSAQELGQAFEAEGWSWRTNASSEAAEGVQPTVENDWVIDPFVEGVTGRAYIDEDGGAMVLHFEETLRDESSGGLVAGVAMKAREIVMEASPGATLTNVEEGQDTTSGC